MAFEFQFPDVGEGIHEGRLVEWLVEEGNSVENDAPLARVETDKAVVEIPSPTSGKVTSLKFNEGDTICVGDVIVVFDGTNGTVDTSAAPTASAQTESALRQATEEVASPTASLDREPSDLLHRPLATPHTRKYARGLGVDLSTLTGTGKGGRITDEDVDRAAQRGVSSAGAPATSVATPSKTPTRPVATGLPMEEERIKPSHMRKVIAEAMAQSKKTSAHVTHVDEADVSELLELYGRMKTRMSDEYDLRLTLMPFFVRALVAVLKDHPEFNSSYDAATDELVLKKNYNIGMAVDTPEGLIVPVLRDADRKSLATLATEIGDKAQRAAERRLGVDELRGGTCTITNIGPVGGLFATPIIRQPEMAIVAFHAIKKRPVVVGDDVVARKMMYLSVAFDHRWVDGAQAARFMNDLVKLLENPELLMARM